MRGAQNSPKIGFHPYLRRSVLEDVCVHNNGVLEVSTSRSTTSSSNNNTTIISSKLICLPTNRSLHPTQCSFFFQKCAASFFIPLAMTPNLDRLFNLLSKSTRPNWDCLAKPSSKGEASFVGVTFVNVLVNSILLFIFIKKKLMSL